MRQLTFSSDSLFTQGNEPAVAVREGSPRAGGGDTSAAAAAPGLSLLNKWPQRKELPPGHFRMTVAEGGECVSLVEVGTARPRPENAAVRGEIKGFSRSSRLQCLKTINSIDRRRVTAPWFITLTVPQGEAYWKMMERHRRAWFKRLKRRYPGEWFAVWKKEPHKSGTVHMHVLLFWLVEPPRWKDFVAWNDDAWADVVKSNNPHHRSYGCRVEMMRSWNGVKSYTAKYLGKEQEMSQVETGRIWGVENRLLMPREIREEEIEPEVGKRTRRCLRKLQERRREFWQVQSEGRWYPIRPKQGLPVAEQVERAKQAGFRVRRRRPRLCFNRPVQVWFDEWDDDGTGRVVPGEVEIQAVTCSTHFVGSETIRKLVAFTRHRVAHDAALVADVPF